MFKVIICLSLLISIVSCSATKDTVCYSFDEKQCLFDPWASSDLVNPKEDNIKSYLSTQGIEIKEIYIDMMFHGVTCLACEICPSGPRIYVEIEEQYESQIRTLPLLSLAKTDCSNIP